MKLPSSRKGFSAPFSEETFPPTDDPVAVGDVAAAPAPRRRRGEAYSQAQKDFVAGLLTLREFEVFSDEFFRERSGAARAEPDGSPADDETRKGVRLEASPPDQHGDAPSPGEDGRTASVPDDFFFTASSSSPSAAPLPLLPARVPPASPFSPPPAGVPPVEPTMSPSAVPSGALDLPREEGEGKDLRRPGLFHRPWKLAWLLPPAPPPPPDPPSDLPLDLRLDPAACDGEEEEKEEVRLGWPPPSPPPPRQPWGWHWPQPGKSAYGSVEPPRRQRGGAVPGPVVSRGLRVSHVPLHIRGADAQAAFRERMAAAPRVIIDYGKPYDDDFEFLPNELTPRHFTCVGEEDCDGSY